MDHNFEMRIYKRNESIVFRKTKEEFGGLSNMAAGFPIKIFNVIILSSEALYQACRYPNDPEIQMKIISERSPMTAKMKSKAFRSHCRMDWDDVRIQVMRWCIRVKLFQNWRNFSELIFSTGNFPIVEESKKDAFWGAQPSDKNLLVGVNALGRLLMELRLEIRAFNEGDVYTLKPPNISNFKFLGNDIPEISFKINRTEKVDTVPKETNIQTSIFDI